MDQNNISISSEKEKIKNNINISSKKPNKLNINQFSIKIIFYKKWIDFLKINSIKKFIPI